MSYRLDWLPGWTLVARALRESLPYPGTGRLCDIDLPDLDLSSEPRARARETVAALGVTGGRRGHGDQPRHTRQVAYSLGAF